jgi:hypothetical protein
MKRSASWKVFTIGAALAGLSVIGAGAATAQTDVLRESAVSAPQPQSNAAASRDCANVGPFTTHCQTRGSSQIYTAPNPDLGRSAGVYGPFFNQNRGIASALR